MSGLSPLGDILVLGLTRGSYRVYKTVIGMCERVSPVLRLFRVTESSLSCRVCRRVSRRAGLLSSSRTIVTGGEICCHIEIAVGY